MQDEMAVFKTDSGGIMNRAEEEDIARMEIWRQRTSQSFEATGQSELSRKLAYWYSRELRE